MAQTIECVDLHGEIHSVDIAKLAWRPSAYAIVIKDGSLLLTPQNNGYDLPGGGVEFGEMPEQAVIREVKEETGIDVIKPSLLKVASNFFTFPVNGESKYFQSILLYYVCDFSGGELSQEGFTEYEKDLLGFPEWVNLAELDAKIAENGFGSSYNWRPLIQQVLNQT